MSLANILIWILFGAIAGWAAGQLMGSPGGLIRNVILGIIGSFVGGWIAGQLGLNVATGFNLVGLLVAIGGAIVVIVIGRLLFK